MGKKSIGALDVARHRTPSLVLPCNAESSVTAFIGDDSILPEYPRKYNPNYILHHGIVEGINKWLRKDEVGRRPLTILPVSHSPFMFGFRQPLTPMSYEIQTGM